MLEKYAYICYRPKIAFLLWIAVFTAWFVSVFSVIRELCLVNACRDTASFTIFGVNMGWFGIAYFSFIPLLLYFRRRHHWLDWVLSATVFAGIGAELRLLWIQKYIIGGWCPLCVTICCALFVTAMLLLIEKVPGARSGEDNGKILAGWTAFVLIMIALGLVIAVIGVHALT